MADQPKSSDNQFNCEGFRPSDTESVAASLHKESAQPKIRQSRSFFTVIIFLLAAFDILVSCLTVVSDSMRLPLRIACGCSCFGGVFLSGKLAVIEKPFHLPYWLQLVLGIILSAFALFLTVWVFTLD